jgi:hypothetical protein
MPEPLGESRWLDEAERVVANVERVLGRPRGCRIDEAVDRDRQYFHCLAMWLFARAQRGDLKPKYRERDIALARDIHPAFVIPGRSVIWKMKEKNRRHWFTRWRGQEPCRPVPT